MWHAHAWPHGKVHAYAPSPQPPCTQPASPRTPACQPRVSQVPCSSVKLPAVSGWSADSSVALLHLWALTKTASGHNACVGTVFNCPGAYDGTCGYTTSDVVEIQARYAVNACMLHVACACVHVHACTCMLACIACVVELHTHMPRATCQMPNATCHMPHATCHMPHAESGSMDPGPRDAYGRRPLLLPRPPRAGRALLERHKRAL